MTRKPYPTHVSDEEWAFVASYLTLMREAAPQRDHSLREVFNGVRWMVRTGGAWRLMPHDLPPWYTVYPQTQRWLKAGVFEVMVQDLREILRILAGRNEQPSAVILDSRTLHCLRLTACSMVESGHRAGYDGGKRKKGSKVHIAVDKILWSNKTVEQFRRLKYRFLRSIFECCEKMVCQFLKAILAGASKRYI